MTSNALTPLDAAHAAMAAAPDDDAARLRFFARLADAPLLLLLVAEAAGDTVEPRLFPLKEGSAVMAFDADMLIDCNNLSHLAKPINPTGLLRHINPTQPQH